MEQATSTRTWVLVLALVVVVAAGGAMTFLGARDSSPEWPWRPVPVDVALSEDRSTILVLDRDYHSPSCHDHRVVVDRGPRRWRVSLEVRSAGDGFCTLEGCIRGGDGFGPEDAESCGVYARRIPGGVPDDVELVRTY